MAWVRARDRCNSEGKRGRSSFFSSTGMFLLRIRSSRHWPHETMSVRTREEEKARKRGRCTRRNEQSARDRRERERGNNTTINNTKNREEDDGERERSVADYNGVQYLDLFRSVHFSPSRCNFLASFQTRADFKNEQVAGKRYRGRDKKRTLFRSLNTVFAQVLRVSERATFPVQRYIARVDEDRRRKRRCAMESRSRGPGCVNV